MGSNRLVKLIVIAAGAGCVGAISMSTSSLGSSAHAARGHTVVLRNSTFLPGKLTINRGDSVTWVWRDGGILHNVIAHSFRSHTQTHGSFTERFTRRGSFSYVCTIHPLMTGRIIVR